MEHNLPDVVHLASTASEGYANTISGDDEINSLRVPLRPLLVEIYH